MADNINLLIGRDPDTNRLAVRTSKGQLMLFGKDGSVPNSVSRFKADQNTAHAQLSINPMTQKMEIINLNPNNYTWVGKERVTSEPVELKWKSKVTLGGDYYKLNLTSILEKIGLKKPIDVRHLEAVWEHYDRELYQLQVEQQKKANQQRIQSLCSLLGMALMFGAQAIDVPDHIASLVTGIRYSLIGVAFLLAVYFYMKGRNVNESFTMKKRKLDEWLKENYVCPDCGAPIAPSDFKQLGYKKCINCLGKFSIDG